MKHVIFFILALFLSQTLNAQESKFKKACKKNTIEEFNEFIFKYPFSEYTEEASFRRAELINTSEGFEQFLEEYPSGNFFRKADSILCFIEFHKISSPDNLYLWDKYFMEFRTCPNYGAEIKNKLIMVEFKKAEAANTVKAYQDFISKYPNCEFDTLAQKKMQKLEYDKLKLSASTVAVNDFIQKYPDGYFVSEANEYLEYLESEIAINSNSVDTLNAFILKYPDSKYKKVVYRKIEELEYQKAAEINTIEVYTGFLEKYPGGEYSFFAKQEIGQINFNDQPLVKNLKSSNPQEVSNAVEQLGAMKNPYAVEPLIAVFSDYSISKREIAESLVMINDTSAVVPLISILNDENYEYDGASDAAWALGEIGDKRAVQPLVEALDDYYLSESAAEALGKIGDTTAIPILLIKLKGNGYGNEGAAVALGKMGARQAIPELIEIMQIWDSGEAAAEALLALGWSPVSLEEKVHFWVAQRNKRLLIANWSDTKRILLKDAISGNYNPANNAVYAFIIIGKKEIIPDLISILNTYGEVTLAETYLNCGNDELGEAAETWASENGYSVSYSGGGSSAASWGGD